MHFGAVTPDAEDGYGPLLGSKTPPMIPMKEAFTYPKGDTKWPVEVATNAGSGSNTTSLSHTPEPVVSPTQFAILIDALREQTAAIGKLIRSNEALILAMAQVDQEPDPDAPQTHYLSGKRI